MDKNLITAVVLSMLVYALWFGFMDKRAPAPPISSPQTVAQAPTGKTAASEPKAPVSTAAPAPADKEAILARADKIDLGGSEIRIHPAGAAIVSYNWDLGD